jgi:hypothetical protein
MKMYLVCLLLVPSWIGMTPEAIAVAQSKTAATKGYSPAKTISPAAALERLIVAKTLAASWFTPELLKAVDKNSDVGALQLQRDITMKLGRFRYGNYKSVQPIGNNKYRVLFDRAEPDAVIVNLQVDASGRIAAVGIAEKNKPEPTAKAQALALIALDRSFKTNTRITGENSPILTSLKQWLGNYQKVQKVDATSYLGIFDRGSAPVTINFKPDGSIENYGMGCPTTKLSLKQAPTDLQKVLEKCPNLK